MRKSLILTFIICFLLAGCKSKAEKEAQDIQKVTKVAGATINQPTEQEHLKMAAAEISLIAFALAVYITDGGKLPAQEKPSDWLLGNESSISKALVPQYLKSLPLHDPWGKPYEIYFGKTDYGKVVYRNYGIQEPADNDFLIVSLGMNGAHEKWQYDPKNPEAGLFSEFDQTNNLINFNGTMIRGMKK